MRSHMKYVIRRQSFKAYTMTIFFITLISIFVLSGFTYAANEAGELASSPGNQVPKTTPSEGVVEPSQSPKKPEGTTSITEPVPPKQSQDAIPIPGVERIEGIAWQGKYLWVLDGEKNKIDQFDPTSDKPGPVRSLGLTQALDFDLKKLKGLAFDGKALWAADEEKKALIKINPEDGKTEKPIKMEVPVDKGFKSIEGIAWDGEYLWIAIYAGYSSSFNQINPVTGKIVKSIFADCFPRGIAIDKDGDYLWSICYNGKKLPSKIDKRKIREKDCKISDYEIFHSRVYIKDIEKDVDPIGLVYDGKDLWYADKVAKTATHFTPSDIKQKPVVPPLKTK